MCLLCPPKLAPDFSYYISLDMERSYRSDDFVAVGALICGENVLNITCT